MAMVSLAALAAARRSSSTSARSADAVLREAEHAACGVRRGETKGVKQSVCFSLFERLRFCLFNLYCSREANTNLASNFALPYLSQSYLESLVCCGITAYWQF
ncbi:hypothetical protein PVAP13_5KG455207 [Panicum virgatum]|uniref:Uncharacterized protein n=1 Tax=Panicum virgatum TaxID=38727 RepID=A0A8T0ST40_PANVG|nr:hypothetical protein PVAP13_5KG455207 [Panicum virgatum]